VVAERLVEHMHLAFETQETTSKGVVNTSRVLLFVSMSLAGSLLEHQRTAKNMLALSYKAPF
jgi:hypothetical protein